MITGCQCLQGLLDASRNIFFASQACGQCRRAGKGKATGTGEPCHVFVRPGHVHKPAMLHNISSASFTAALYWLQGSPGTAAEQGSGQGATGHGFTDARQCLAPRQSWSSGMIGLETLPELGRVSSLPGRGRKAGAGLGWQSAGPGEQPELARPGEPTARNRTFGKNGA